MNFIKSLFIQSILLVSFISCDKEESTPSGGNANAETFILETTIEPLDGGTINPETGSHKKGESFNVTAIPALNYKFKKFEGSLSGTDNPLTIALYENETITAVFEMDNASITNGLVINYAECNTSDNMQPAFPLQQEVFCSEKKSVHIGEQFPTGTDDGSYFTYIDMDGIRTGTYDGDECGEVGGWFGNITFSVRNDKRYDLTFYLWEAHYGRASKGSFEITKYDSINNEIHFVFNDLLLSEDIGQNSDFIVLKGTLKATWNESVI